MAASAITIPTSAFDPAPFRWHRSPSDPLAVERRANGLEALIGWDRGEQLDNYACHLNATLRVPPTPASSESSFPSSTITLAALRAAVEAALVDLRFQHPEIAATVAQPDHDCDPATPPSIRYRPPDGDAAAAAWARGIVRVHAAGALAAVRAHDGPSLAAAQERIRRAAASSSSKEEDDARSLPSTSSDSDSSTSDPSCDEQPRGCPPVVVHLASADAADDRAVLRPGARVDLLCRFNHVFLDGTSMRMLVADLLRRVAAARGLVGPSAGAPNGLEEHRHHHHHDAWGDEIANLAAPIFDASSVDLSARAGEAEATLKELMGRNLKLMGTTRWALLVAPDAKPAGPRTIRHTFTRAQSAELVRAVRARLGPGHTITHLAQAAILLAVLDARPPPDGDEAPTRREEDLEGETAPAPAPPSLAVPFPINGRAGLRPEARDPAYYPICLGSGLVVFEDLRAWAAGGAGAGDESHADAVRAKLDGACRVTKAAYDHWRGKETNLVANVAMVQWVAGMLASTKKTFSGAPGVPTLTSDGIVDRFIPGELTAPTGEQLFVVDDCWLFPDLYTPEISIRMDSWKGATSVTITFNEGFFDCKTQEAFFQNVVKYMLMFA